MGIVRVKQKRGRKEEEREVTYLHECIFSDERDGKFPNVN